MNLCDHNYCKRTEIHYLTTNLLKGIQMKQLKIEEKNSEAINGTIKQVEGKSIVNCLSVRKILALANEAEERLEELGIPQKCRVGVQLYSCPAGPDSKSYQYAQGATDVKIIRKSSGWYIEAISRTNVYPKKKESLDLLLTEEQRDIAVRKFCSSFITMKNSVSA